MKTVPASTCPRCEKPPGLCVCEAIRELSTRLHVLILQHPQEPDKELGSARLTHLSLPNSTLRVGLSWPNLKKALGRPDTAGIQPSRWLVLYLGSGLKATGSSRPEAGLHLVSKAGAPLPISAAEAAAELDGIVLLDGTWSQAKALWWRNAWLLKLKRGILVPRRKSLYGELRREPRKEALSTIESAAETLTALGEPESVAEGLRAIFGELLAKRRLLKKSR